MTVRRAGKIRQVQRFLQEMRADGWLLYDFHRSNKLVHLFLEIPEHTLVTRRFFYWIPAHGEPVRLMHRIESHLLDGWPGEKRAFLSWQSLHKELGALLKGAKRVAMEYSPQNSNPYVSLVDGGTVDLIRSFGVEIVSSGAFLSHFTAVIDEKQGQSHLRAAAALDRIVREVWIWIGDQLRCGRPITEYVIQQEILAAFQAAHLISESPPIVGVNAHSADPHYEPRNDGSSLIRAGDFLLIDLFAKEEEEGAVYGDITKVAIAAERPTKKQALIFEIVRKGQKAGIALVQSRFAERKQVMGYEIDDAVRQVIEEAGYGEFFFHRTGHSIDVNLHGSGTHIDNLEMHDERTILPGTCFSIEPGIYLPGEFGVRLESDIYVHKDGRVEVTGGEQDAIHPIFQH